MALSVDGHVIGATGNTQSRAVSLTTTLTNNIIVAFAHGYNAGTGVGSSTFTVSSPSLTWTRRGTLRVAGGFGQLIELWWALAAGTLSSESITATISGGANFNQISVAAFAVNGANTTTPFDSNASLPATAGTNSGGTNSITYSTSNANDMLIGFEADSSSNPATWTGFTQLDTNSAISLFLKDEYQIVSSTQSNVSITGTTATADAIFLDAIQQAGGGGGGSIILPPGLFETMAL